MATSHGGGGPSRSATNHPALASSAVPLLFQGGGAVGSVCISNSYNPQLRLVILVS